MLLIPGFTITITILGGFTVMLCYPICHLTVWIMHVTIGELPAATHRQKNSFLILKKIYIEKIHHFSQKTYLF